MHLPEADKRDGDLWNGDFASVALVFMCMPNIEGKMAVSSSNDNATSPIATADAFVLLFIRTAMLARPGAQLEDLRAENCCFGFRGDVIG